MNKKQREELAEEIVSQVFCLSLSDLLDNGANFIVKVRELVEEAILDWERRNN